MARIVPDWRFDLIEAHPDLFHPLPDNPGVAQASPACGAGWWDLLERACARIRAAIQADGGTLKFTQIKEKYGTARLYWEGALSPEADARVEEIIDLAEARSACTCEVCGEEGRLHCDGRWLMTRCAAHAQGHPSLKSPAGRTSPFRVWTPVAARPSSSNADATSGRRTVSSKPIL